MADAAERESCEYRGSGKFRMQQTYHNAARREVLREWMETFFFMRGGPRTLACGIGNPRGLCERKMLRETRLAS